MSSDSDRFAELDRARDELFSHIHRCGVLRAEEEQQTEWMDDTVDYLSERYPELTREQLGELRTIGLRFCRPVIVNRSQDVAPETGETGSADSEAAAA